MNWEEQGIKLVNELSPVYKPESEYKLLKSIISIMYNQHMDIDDAEKMLYGIYDNLPSHSVDRTTIFKLLEDIFVEETKPNNGIGSLEKTISIDYGDKLAAKSVKRISHILIPEKNISNTYPLSNNTWIEIDTFNNKVNYKSLTSVKNEQIQNTIPTLLCRPYKVIVYEDPLAEGKREFTITWKTNNGTYFTTSNVGISDIKSQLSESGYILQPKYADNAIIGSLQIFQDNGLAEYKNEIQKAGFYYNRHDNSIIVVDYDVRPVVEEEVLEGLSVLEDLKDYFMGNEDKLATTIKHGLQVPFGFAKKQMGLPLEYLIPYMYHFGKSGSGKTTIARIALWLYQRPSVDVNDIGGTEFDTVPRIGEQLRKFTFGMIINEPETCLQKKSCAATLKTTVERTNSRQKFQSNRMQHILALVTASFASNIPLPNHEGLPRRFVQLLYNYSEKKTDEQKDKFMTHFKLNNPDECEFNKLQHLGNFVVNEIMNDVDLLQYDWKQLGNILVERMYKFTGQQVPLWLLEYTESVTDEDLEADEVEDIRMFFLSEINRKSPLVKLYASEDGRPINQEVFYQDEVKTGKDFENKVWNVLNESLISYMVVRENNEDIREVCFTSGLKKVLNGHDITCYSLSSTAELLGWEYKLVKIDDKPVRCMIVNFRKFLQFLYPNLEEV